MAQITRHRHGAKRYTSKCIAHGELTTGASCPHGSPVWTNFTIKLRDGASCTDSYDLEIGRAELERIVAQLVEYLERDAPRHV